MSRAIEFRGKRLDNGEWVYGLLVNEGKRIQCKLRKAEYGPPRLIREEHTIDPETMGQFTGLKDKNGVKIFEGDLLNICYEDDDYLFDCIYRVEMSHRGVEFRFDRLPWDSYGYNQRPIYTTIASAHIYTGWTEYENSVVDIPNRGNYIHTKFIEIIGNIHTTPELLEEQSK